MEMWETVLCLEGAALIFLVAGLVCLLVKGKREKKTASLAKKKLREGELDQELVNPIAARYSDAGGQRADMAYNVEYHEEKQLASEACVRVQLAVESSLATRKYLIPLKDRISIGSDKRKNQIVIDGQGIAGIHCRFLRHGCQLYLQGAEASVRLKRGNKVYEVGEDSPELLAGDKILVGNSIIKILKIEA